jgi:hypothetical protein
MYGSSHMVRVDDLLVDIRQKHVSYESVIRTLTEGLSGLREQMHKREAHVKVREDRIANLTLRLGHVFAPFNPQ